MQNKTSLSAHPFALGAITLLFLAGIGGISPAFADDAAMQAAAPAASSTAAMDARVESRIKDLHTRLAITAAQEDSWGKVVQVMRDNESTMAALTSARADKAASMTAVDDLNSYAEIASAHADGLHKFAPVFGTLYDSMSDAQKANADAIFRAHGGMGGMGGKHKHKHSMVG
jgi:hypothetical protein